MVTPTYRFSPFDQRHSSEALIGKRPAAATSPGVFSSAGRTPFAEIVSHSGDDAPGEPSDLSAPGRHPSSIAETDHAQASLSDTAVGRPVSGLHARRLGDAAQGTSADLLHLAARLERGARDAGRLAGNVEVLAARLQREIPLSKSVSGVTYAASEQAEHAQLLADAHAFVVRCAAQPRLPEILAALERGEQVFTVRAHDPSVLFSAADNRPARAGVVGSDVNPTLSPRKLLSGVIHFLTGHRKSSSPAHQSAPVSVDEHHHGSRIGCGKLLAGNGQ